MKSLSNHHSFRGATTPLRRGTGTVFLWSVLSDDAARLAVSAANDILLAHTCGLFEQVKTALVLEYRRAQPKEYSV
jgi:hypothetical protein